MVELASNQRWFWFLNKLTPDYPFGNRIMSMEVTGLLEPSILSQCLAEIQRCYANLRLIFRVQDDYPVQIHTNNSTFTIFHVDLSQVVPARQGDEVEQLLYYLINVPINLTIEHLHKVCLIRLRPDKHILLLIASHALVDAQSAAIVCRDLSRLYTATLAGKASPVNIVYPFDFGHWEREFVDLDPEFTNGLAYWRKQLNEARLMLAWPHKRTTQQDAAPDYRRIPFKLPLSLITAIRNLSHSLAIPVSTVLRAAFRALLFYYTDHDDIVICFPLQNRSHADFEKNIGCFANLALLRVSLAMNPSFRTLLEKEQCVLDEAITYERLPFIKLVEAIYREWSLNTMPQLPVVFAWQEDSGKVDVSQSVHFHSATVAYEIWPADFTISCQLIDDDLTGVLVYRADRFEKVLMQQFIKYYEVVLNQLVHNSDRCVQSLAILSQEELQKLLLKGINETAGSYRHVPTIHQQFFVHAKRSSETVAVYDGQNHLTYGTLNRRANQLANYLRRIGVASETVVAICFPPGVDLIVSMLGVLKAGGAYLPIDPAYPQRRIQYLLEAAQVSAVLSQETYVNNLPKTKQQVLFDIDWEAVAQEDANLPDVYGYGDNLAYVIYTSGSTGQPKGVCCTHQSVINLISDFSHYQPVVLNDTCSLWTSPSFDVSVYEIFSALLAGGTLKIVPESIRTNATLYPTWLADEAVNSAYIPPFMIEKFAEWIHKSPQPLPLKRLLVGVEPILESFLNKIKSEIPKLCILNGYGPTEATVCTTLYTVNARYDWSGYTPIGSPVQNLEVYVLDKKMQLVAYGTVGELYIGGVGLARGYLYAPSQTSERFVPHPFCQGPGARLYRTGDLVRWVDDHHLMFVGRVDYQLKIQGYRIEPGEVEVVLRQYPAICDAAVIAYTQPNKQPQLAAFIVPKSKDTPPIPQIKQYLLKRLPQYMVPTLYMFVNALPLTPNHKLDRKMLYQLMDFQKTTETELVEPRTFTESALINIWSNVLATHRIGVFNDFFELGGQSLQALKVLTKIQSHLDVEIPLHVFYELSTIALLAEYIDTVINKPSTQIITPISTIEREKYQVSLASDGTVVLPPSLKL